MCSKSSIHSEKALILKTRTMFPVDVDLRKVADLDLRAKSKLMRGAKVQNRRSKSKSISVNSSPKVELPQKTKKPLVQSERSISSGPDSNRKKSSDPEEGEINTEDEVRKNSHEESTIENQPDDDKDLATLILEKFPRRDSRKSVNHADDEFDSEQGLSKFASLFFFQSRLFQILEYLFSSRANFFRIIIFFLIFCFFQENIFLNKILLKIKKIIYKKLKSKF